MCKKYNHLIEPDVKLKKCIGGQFKNRIAFKCKIKKIIYTKFSEQGSIKKILSRFILLFKDTRYEEINAEITKSLNIQKVFPDYHDVHNWIIKANEESNLNLEYFFFLLLLVDDN